MINDTSNLTSGKNLGGAERVPYVEPKVSSAAVEQLMSKLQGNKEFGELGALAKAMDVQSISEKVIQKLEVQMGTMSDEDMSKVMALGMQIMLQFKNEKPNIGKITKDIFSVLKILKIDVTAVLFELNESISDPKPEAGSMFELMTNYMTRARVAENAVHMTFKESFFGFISDKINEGHRYYRRQFN